MAKLILYPALGQTVLDLDGNVIPTSGIGPVEVLGGNYYDLKLQQGLLLRLDPLSSGALPLLPTAFAGGMVNVLTFGAVPDGPDATSALRAAIATGAPLFFPPGVYTVSVPEAAWADPVNGHALHIIGATKIDWVGYGATIFMSSATWYTGRTANLKLQNCTNVSIRGLKFDGNRAGRGATSTGGASCVDILGGSKVTFKDVTIVNSCMDGLSIAPVTPSDFSTYPTDYEFENVSIEYSYRNGLALIAGRRLTFRGGRWYRNGVDGTPPAAGADCEPNETDLYGLEGVIFDGVRFDSNAGEGLLITGSSPEVVSESGTGNGTVTDLSVYGPTKVGNYTLSCITAAANGGTFRLTDPDGVIISSSLVMTAGAGVATDFYAGGLHFKITDGAVDFATNKVFTISGGQTHSRGVQVDNISGNGNVLGLMHLGVCRDVQVNGLSAVSETVAFSNTGLVFASRAAHGFRLGRADFSSITDATSDKACLYIDGTGIGHRIDGITGRELYCRLINTPNHGLEISNVTVDGAFATEAAVELSGNGQILRNYTARRCANYSLRLNSAAGSIVDGVHVVDPLNNSIRIAGAGATLKNITGYHSGNAPGTLIQFDAGATPAVWENCQAVAAGTPYTAAGAWALPTSSAFKCSRITPNPFSGVASWNPASINAGAGTSTTVAVTGAVVGDKCTVTHSITLGGAISHAEVSSAGTATITLFNPTGSPIDLGSHNVTVEVVK